MKIAVALMLITFRKNSDMKFFCDKFKSYLVSKFSSFDFINHVVNRIISIDFNRSTSNCFSIFFDREKRKKLTKDLHR